MDQAIGCQNPEGTSAQADESQIPSEKVVSLTFASWNRIIEWLRRLDDLRLLRIPS
jgi:hypothetical protein